MTHLRQIMLEELRRRNFAETTGFHSPLLLGSSILGLHLQDESGTAIDTLVLIPSCKLRPCKTVCER